MTDYALDQSGAQICMASSTDPSHPAEHIIDGKESTFWTTTGLYPQEVIIGFGRPVSIRTIKTNTRNGACCFAELAEAPSGAPVVLACL